MIDLVELAGLSETELEARARRDPTWLPEVVREVSEAVESDRQTYALAHYQSANPMAEPAHYSMARELALCGGNRSSKTETMLSELAIQMTGLVPDSLRARYPREKLRPPIRARIVCSSLTDVLEPVIKPKLRWDQWQGVDEQRGHWGWIPKDCLLNGKWEDSYSEKYRTLKVAVESTWGAGNAMRQWSSCSFLSYDQELTAFAGTSLHFVGHDELPPSRIYRENRMRTLDVK